MRKLWKVIFWGVGLLLAGGLLVLLALWLALRHVPAGYQELVTPDPTRAVQSSNEMVRRSLDLRNSLARGGPWQACFSAEHLNGWFAVDMLQNHPGLLPTGWSEPRVQITPDGIVGYCRLRQGMIDSVVSLHCEVSLPEPNVLAVRICRVRAGVLPLPLKEVIDRISQVAAQRQIRLHWRQAGGDPVALVHLDFRHPESKRQVQVESFQIQDGTLCLRGSTK